MDHQSPDTTSMLERAAAAGRQSLAVRRAHRASMPLGIYEDLRPSKMTSGLDTMERGHYIPHMPMILSPMANRIGWGLAALGLVTVLAGFLLESIGLSIDPEVPFHKPFWEAGCIVLLAGLLMQTLSRRVEEDEFLDRLRLEAFQVTLIATALLIAANEVVYFWGDRLLLSARSVVILQLASFLLLFRARLRAASRA